MTTRKQDEKVPYTGFGNGAQRLGLRKDDIDLNQQSRLWVWILLLVAVIIVFAKLNTDSVFGSENVLIQVLITSFFLTAPGLTLLNAMGVTTEIPLSKISAAVGISVIEIMILGAASSYVLPIFGVLRPLESPLTGILLFAQVTLCCVVSNARGRDPFDGAVPKLSIKPLLAGSVWAVLPVLTVLASRVLTDTGDNVIAIWVAALTLISILALSVFAHIKKSSFSIVFPMFSVTTAMVWLTSTRGEWVNGFDIQTELGIVNATIQQGSWAVPEDGNAYASMLSLTVFPSFFSTMASLSGIAMLKFVYPLFAALLIANLSALISKIIGPSGSVALVSLIFLQNTSFFQELPALARQEIALFLFATMVLFITDRTVSRRHAQTLILVFAIGVSLSHYSTSYIASALLGSAYLINGLMYLTIFRKTQKLISRRLTWYVVAPAMLSSWIWNGLITKSTGEVFRLVEFLRSNGIDVLPGFAGNSGNFFEAWLQGTNAQVKIAPSDVVTESAAQREEIWRWMQLDADSEVWIPEITDDGAVPAIIDSTAGELLSGISEISTQGVLFIVVGSAVLFAFALFRQRQVIDGRLGLRLEIFGLLIASLFLAGLLRVSASFAEFYSPNRVAIQLAVVFIIPIALAWRSARVTVRRFGFPVILMLFALTSTLHWNLQTLLVGGQLPPWASATSQPAAQNIPSLQDIAASKWMAENIGQGQLVSADVYSSNFMTSQGQLIEFNVFPSAMPLLTDLRGYVFASTHNVVAKWGFDKFRGVTFAYEFPLSFFQRSRLTVYSTETTVVVR